MGSQKDYQEVRSSGVKESMGSSLSNVCTGGVPGETCPKMCSKHHGILICNK